MKTKQKEDKPEDDPAPESSGKTRARKKLNADAEEKNQEPEKKTTRKRVGRKPAAVKKRPLGISKTLRSKKTVITKDKVKAIVKLTRKQGKPIRKLKARLKSEANEEKPAIIPASEIKKEPLEEPAHGSRSSSPKTSGPRRQRLTSDIQMMRSTLAESPTSLLLGSRTSPYSMRSERSNSPFRPDAANLRSGRQRSGRQSKLKNNLLNEIVKNEQKKRRLGSDGKSDVSPDAEDAKKLKRGRSFSRDGSELSATESDLSLCEASTDTDRPDKEVKTELDLEEEGHAPALTPAPLPADAYKVPSAVQCKSEDTGTSFSLIDSNKIQTVKRSTSLDSDNNNRMKVDDVPSAIDNKAGIELKTENPLFAERDTILTNMSKTFNTKEMTKNVRKARRGRKNAAPSKDKKTEQPSQGIPAVDSFSKEINDLIETLEQCDRSDEAEKALSESQNVDSKVSSPDAIIKSTTKFYSLQPVTVVDTSKAPTEKVIGSLYEEDKSEPMETVALEHSNLINKETDDAENIRLQISDEDSQDKTEESTKENVKTLTAFKPSTQDIDKLMDKLKHFEELDKKRQLELKAKTEAVMVTDDVVLIPKSGADIKPLKDIQATISADRVLDKGSVLSCFQNNSAISIVTKRDHVRKSIDHDLPNSITLIKRNSSSRKESTGSNSGDTISIIEKSLGKDVTLTELRRSIDKPNAGSLESSQTLHSLATIQPNKPGTVPQSIATITPSLSVISKDQPQTNGSETSKIVRKHERRPALLSEDSSEKAKSEAVNNSLERIMSPPLPVEISVKSHIAEPIKSPLRTMKSPPLEIISVQPLFTEASKPVTQDTSVAVTVVSVISTDLPKDIIINADKSITSTVTSPSADVKITANPLVDIPMKDDVAVKVAPAIVIKPDVKIPPEVMIPPPEVKVPQPDVKIPQPDVKIPPPVAKIPPPDVKIPLPAVKIPSPDLKITPSDLKITPPDLKIIPPDVKIPQPDTPKEAVTSPRGDDRKPKSETKSPHKVSTSPKETAKLPSPARTSTKTDMEAVPGTSGMLLETPERQKRKESILRTLGLLTLKAADEAKIEKQKQKEMFATKSNKSVTKMHSGESSGTLRTVIKLNRGLNTEKKSKNRSSLKMTFQKAKVRAGKPSLESGELSESDDTYYTIHKEGATTTPGSGSIATGGHRKSHNNRFNNHDGNGAEQPAKSPEPAAAKEVLNLVIPEKASSFSIHPGRLCQDQCFYCGGNFGLFDTPCHIAQMKSAERQKKVLDNEEKLTMDSCLCDACYRHVDRRANCPSYRKRPNLVTKPSALPHMGIADGKSKTSEETSQAEGQSAEDKLGGSGRAATCHAEGCSELADHSIRRKWLIKMRTSVNRVVKLQLDYPGLHTIPLCAAHYRPVSQLMVCALCRRRLTKHHNIHFINHPLEELNPRLAEQGVPVSFAEKPAVCKLCRYFCTLLFRPHQQLNKKHFLKLHRRRLLQTYNMELPEDSESEAAAEEPKESMDVDPNIGKQKKKNKSGKSKQRKSTDSNKYPEETPDNPEKDRDPSALLHTTHPMEEDIESLISTNKISKGPDVNPPSDHSDADTVMDVDATLVPSFDKQSELQYLLQKQNNPAQFLQVPAPNLTQKQRNVLKAHNASAIQKPATQTKICEKNAKRIQKLGQVITQKDKSKKDDESSDGEKKDTGSNILKNISLTDECTIESIPPRKAADIAVLKNKWQMSESFTQVKRNLSELSKNVDKPKSRSGDSRYSNPVRRLETNPSISVRELFPGEDEMNLQCSIEFNNVKGVTPEGWEKCNTTIQYDVETRKLWNELQKPYGNQSSFLRHLVLLEKYFRSGDLVLAPNANGHAINYSDSVQSRLRAYDNVPEPPKRTQPAVSLIEYRKHKTTSGKSLLKSNQSADGAKSSEPKLVPPPIGKSPELPSTSKHLNMNYGGFPPMPSPAVFAKPKSRTLPSTSMAMIEMRPPASKQKSAPPPELISIHTPTPQGRKSIENVLKNIQQLVKGVSAPEPDPIPAPALPPTPPPLPPPLPPPPPPHKETVKKQKTTTKPWRPTLMQITQENLARIAREPTQVAVDGRSLPSLVQVMSGGQRYHITLADYNKMCIMRREKLQQVQVVENSAKAKKPTTEVVTEIQPSTTHGNGGTVTQNVSLSENHTTDSATVSLAPTRSEEAIRAENNAVNILKNVGLKNITIAPVVEKTKPSATVTSQSVLSPVVSSPSLIITSTPLKMPQLGPSVTITSDTLISPGMSMSSPMLPSYGATIQPLVMPKIPKSLTVIPQTVPVTSTVVNLPASLVSMQSSFVGVPPSTVVSVPVSMSMSSAQYPMVAAPVAPQP